MPGSEGGCHRAPVSQRTAEAVDQDDANALATEVANRDGDVAAFDDRIGWTTRHGSAFCAVDPAARRASPRLAPSASPQPLTPSIHDARRRLPQRTRARLAATQRAAPAGRLFASAGSV